MKIIILGMILASVASNVNANKLLDPLFADPSTQSVRLSPDGERYVVAEMRPEKTTMRVYQSASQTVNKQYDLARLFDENTVLRDMQWLDNRHIATMLLDKVQTKTALAESNAQLKLIIFDIESSDADPVMYQVSTPGYLVDGAPDEQGAFYFSRSAHKSKIYRIEISKLLRVDQKRTKLTRVDGGQFVESNVIANADGYALRWFFQKSGQPAAVLLRTEIDKVSLAVYKSASNEPAAVPEEVTSWKLSELNKKEKSKQDEPFFIPIAMASETGKFYSVDVNEPQAFSLYLVDFKQQQNELVFTSPGQPIVDLIFAKNRKAVGVMVVEQGLYKESYFDGQPSLLNTEILQVVTASSLDGKTQIVYQESHNQPGRYVLHQDKKAPVKLFNQYTRLPDSLPSRQVVGTVKVDEFDIPYILTLPQSASKSAPVPLIVMPHGGPFDVYDSSYFSADAQFFAANNFALLRVNFRGSGGYGLQHKEAGKKQWGDKMLLDILSATQLVQQRADIRSSQTCLVGMSYGGYAALMLGIQHPKIFTCAASVAGVTDINLFIKSPYLSPEQQEWITEHVGDSNSDYAKLKSISPVYNINRLSIPLLLIHGAKDQVVNVENGFRIKRLLEQAKIPFEWRLYPEAGHDFSEDDQLVRLYTDILTFVQQHVSN
ncbi:alpha/beta hydrolase family protein [Aliiglaciecola litoralis]|uniref:S9 family peptidase n=1 Tax=Aliiglaciecola litoralis TaxID=582857 RepID=A0ABP3WXS4_9ALTE